VTNPVQSPFGTTPPIPRSETFESGDFVWPKKPGAFVPYNQRPNTPLERDREIWQREKRAFLDRIANKGTYLSAEQIADLKALDYHEFLARYHGDQKPGVPGVYSSGGGIYVGHVGIVDVASNGEIFIIEALWERGVVRSTYQNWLASRADEFVWLGRLKDKSEADRVKISGEASKYLQRPYDFWNFDLNDDSAFYCSKLVWLVVFRSLSVAVDGITNPKRGAWFSPKQLLYLPVMTRLHDPGSYALL
jgi:hypothetical protein